MTPIVPSHIQHLVCASQYEIPIDFALTLGLKIPLPIFHFEEFCCEFVVAEAWFPRVCHGVEDAVAGFGFCDCLAAVLRRWGVSVVGDGDGCEFADEEE